MSRAVIDQPGIRIVVIGFALTMFFGLALRSQISDLKVQTYLNQAIERLNQDISIDYQSARINLSKWGLPIPVVEISQIRLSPKSALCRNSQIYIDELEMPLSLSVLMGGATQIPKMRLHDVEMRISDTDNCFEQNKIVPLNEINKLKGAAASLEGLNESVSSSAQAPKVFLTTTKAELGEVYIDKLKIIFSKWSDQPIFLKQVNIDIKYNAFELEEIQIISKLNAFHDSKTEAYYLNTNFNLLMKKNKSTNLVEAALNIEGKLLDGDVQLITRHQFGNMFLKYDLFINKVSVKAFLPLCPTDLKKKLLFVEKIPSTISFKNSGNIDFKQQNITESKFKNINVNIEASKVSANEISFKSQNGHFEIKPFVILIDSLPISKLKLIDDIKDKTDSFESIGYLSGQFSFADNEEMRFNGVLKQFEIIFSNRGRRDLQRIDEMNLHLQKNKNIVHLLADGLVVDQQKVTGQFELTNDSLRSTLQVKMKLNGKLLNSRVWDQFTYVEQSPEIDLSLIYIKSQNQSEYSLKLEAPKVEFPGVDMLRVKIDLQQTLNKEQPSQDKLSLNIHPGVMMTNEKIYENKYVSQLLKESLGLEVQNFASEKVSISMRGQNWQNLFFNAEANMYVVENKTNSFIFSMNGSAHRLDGFRSQLSVTQRNIKNNYDLYLAKDQQIVFKKSE